MSNELAVVKESSELMSFIERAATDPGFDVEKFRALLDLKERADKQAAERAYSIAMRAAQEEMRRVVRDATNADNHSRYARLETVDAAIRPVYVRHGFSLSFDAPITTGPEITMACCVRHVDGHTERHSLSGAIDDKGPKGAPTKTAIQGLGSTVSYLRRYLTCMIFNVILTNEDNDGQSGGDTITDEQALNLRDRIADAEMTDDRTRQLLESLAVSTIEQIRPKQLVLAQTLIAAEKRRKAGMR